MKDSMKEVNVTLESITVSLDKVRENYITEEKSSFLGRIKLFFTDKSKVVSIDKQTRFLMSIDEVKIDIRDKDRDIKSLYETIDALKAALEKSNLEVDNLNKASVIDKETIYNLTKSEAWAKQKVNDIKKERDLNTGTISEQILKLSSNKDEIESLTNRIEVKTKLLDEKSIELASEKKKHSSCLNRLDEKSSEIKKLRDELKEVNSSINTKITQGIRAKCKVSADGIIKEANIKSASFLNLVKENKKPSEISNILKINIQDVHNMYRANDIIIPDENKIRKASELSGKKIAVEKVIEVRTLHIEGKRPYKISEITGINRSTVIRIINGDSYKDPIYYPPVVENNSNDTVDEKEVCLRGENNTMVHMDEVAYIPTPLVGIAVPPRKSYKKKKKNH